MSKVWKVRLPPDLNWTRSSSSRCQWSRRWIERRRGRRWRRWWRRWGWWSRRRWRRRISRVTRPFLFFLFVVCVCVSVSLRTCEVRWWLTFFFFLLRLLLLRLRDQSNSVREVLDRYVFLLAWAIRWSYPPATLFVRVHERTVSINNSLSSCVQRRQSRAVASNDSPE